MLPNPTAPISARPGLALARRWGARLLPVILLAGAAWVLWRQLHHLSLAEVMAALAAWGPGRIAASLACVAASYLTLAVNEWAGLRWAGAPLPKGVALYGSFCANAFGHTLGSAVLVGAAVRLRAYAKYRPSLAVIIKTTAFCNVSFGLGLVAIAGGGLMLASRAALVAVNLPPDLTRIGGGLLLAMVPGYVVTCAAVRGNLRIAKHDFTLPSARWALAQVAIGLIDNIVTVLVVWTLLPAHAVGLYAFSGAFAVATAVGVVSSVPGGAGVFEGVLLTLLPRVARAPLAAAFLGYRLFFFFIPLAVAGVMMAVQGRGRRRAAV